MQKNSAVKSMKNENKSRENEISFSCFVENSFVSDLKLKKNCEFKRFLHSEMH